jgi:ferredoxin-NADP reductase/ferredoxin/truncated hemoglobin YjbI
MKIHFNDNVYTCREDENLLEMFLRNGVSVPFSCRHGACHACLMRSTGDEIPAVAQKNIKQSLIDKGYFKPCMCNPVCDMDVSLPRAADILTRAVVYKKELLSPDVCRVLIEPATQVYYRAGQFINILRDDGLTRSYSLSSVPYDDYYLEIHVKHIPDGQMSKWIFADLKENDEIEFQGPLGNCYYDPDDQSRNMLLISTGTGLAPHIGIAKDALLSGYSGNIKIYHGAKKYHGHYLWPRLEKLSRQYPSFSYVLCASQEEGNDCVVSGRANQVALQQNNDLHDWTVYLSGQSDMVNETEQAVIAMGVPDDKIYADPFVYAHSISRSDNVVPQNERRKFPDPDPEMWAALNSGTLMHEILEDFYTRVFDDDLLSPYFKGVTKQRLVGKVYNFHYQMFTGEKVYFGERPKNAHHWMVISDELFDHRETLMEFCLREHGLPEHLIKRWLEYENVYRNDIVKSSPANKILFGMEVPLEGFEEIEITASTLCDSCNGEINAGDIVRYHIRLGTTYCPNCMKAMPL